MTGPSACVRCELPLGADAFFCNSCGTAAFAAVHCGACDARVPVDAFFCQRCGIKVRDEEAPMAAAESESVAPAQEQLAPPGKGVTIEVELRAGSEDESLEATMRTMPDFEAGGGADGARIARVTFPSNEVERAIAFAETVEWRLARRVYRDGQLQDWVEFFDFVACYRERGESQNEAEYCFFDDNNAPNLWGCFQLRMALDSSYEASDWLALGQFERDGSFVFDKKSIIGLLDRRSAPYRLCPALEVRRISAALKAMPARANPQQDRDWKYLEDLSGDDPKAVTVNKRDGDKKVKVRIRGVSPATDEAAVRLAQRVRDELD